MNLFAVLTLVFVASFALKEILRRLGVPAVVSQISVGIALGVPVLKAAIFDSPSLSLIDSLSQLGIIFLLFLAGWEIDLRKVMSCAKDAFLIAFSSAFFSFILGFGFLYLFFGDMISSGGFDPIISSLIFGICLSVTAEGTTVKVLMDLKVIKSRVAAVILGAGAIDDIIEVLGMVIVLGLAHVDANMELIYLPLDIVFFSLVVFLVFSIGSRVLTYIERKETDVDFFMLVLIMMFGLVSLSEFLHLGYLIGAIMGGFLIQLIITRRKSNLNADRVEEDEIFEGLKLITLAFLAPFFFINIGLNFDFNMLLVNPGLFVGAVLVACAGKVLGTMILKPLTKLSWSQLYIIGWGMNSRGAVELIMAITAYSAKLIPVEVFSALVATSVMTTLIFPFIIENRIKANPRVMN